MRFDMTYEIHYTTAFEKSFKKIPKNSQIKIKEKLIKLSKNPYKIQGTKKLVDLKLTEYPLYRLRVGKYRIIYEIRKNILIILLIRVERRKGSTYKKI